MRNGIPAVGGDWKSLVGSRFHSLGSVEEVIGAGPAAQTIDALAKGLPRRDVELPEQSAQRVPALVSGDLKVRGSFAVSAPLLITGSLEVEGLLLTAEGSRLTVLGDVRAHAISADNPFRVAGTVDVSGVLVAQTSIDAARVRAVLPLGDGYAGPVAAAFDGRGDLDDLRSELGEALIGVDFEDERAWLDVEALLEAVLDRKPIFQWPGGKPGEDLRWLLSWLETPGAVPELVDALVRRELGLDDAELRVAKDWCLEQSGLSPSAQAYLGSA
ncbi:MAG: hypothetical protein U0228_11680 [Myxococcaceae bacterium]